MNLKTAYLCQDCYHIQDRAPRGVCQVCGSQNIQSVARLLTSPEEKEAWLTLIGVSR